MARELARKAFHSLTILLPIFYLQFGYQLTVQLLMFAVICSAGFDVARYMFPRFGRFSAVALAALLREHEHNTTNFKLAGSSYLFLGALLTVLLFNQETAILALGILAFADGAAALCGKRWGVLRLSATKTLVGSISFAITGLLVVILWSGLWPLSPQAIICAWLAVAVTTLAELFSGPLLDDNLTIPLSFALSYSALQLLLTTATLPS